jgi:antitoxin PrlF
VLKGRTMSKNTERCKIDAIVTVDAKGQIVLPKDLRQKANINPNDKLAVLGLEREGNTCCILLMKTDSLQETLNCKLAPIFQEAFKGGETNK